MDESQGLELTDGNIETVLDEIRPYLVGKRPSASCNSILDVRDDSRRPALEVSNWLLALYSMKLC